MSVSKSSDSADFINFISYRIRKLNRTLSALSMKFEFVCDLDETTTIKIDSYFRRSSGNQYEKALFHVSEMPTPEYARKYYVNFLMKSLETCSNSPQFTPNEKDYILPKVK